MLQGRYAGHTSKTSKKEMMIQKLILIGITIYCSVGCGDYRDSSSKKEYASIELDQLGCGELYVANNYSTENKKIENIDFETLVTIGSANADELTALDSRYINVLSPNENFNKCEWYVKNLYPIIEDKFYLGEFYFICNDIKHVAIILFDLKGKIQDGICFKQMQRSNHGIWDKYYSDFYFISELNIIVNQIDSLNKVIHPSKSPAKCVDSWRIIEVNLSNAIGVRLELE